MVSPQHQFILGLINKAMRQDKIQITYVEGKFLLNTDILPGLPPAILRHRPDLVGVKHSGQICIGDAKTASDVDSGRTKEQLMDFTSIELNGMKCHVYIGIPKRAEDKLRKVLRELDIEEGEFLRILTVAELIINN